MLNRKANVVMGIDIGSHSIKCVEIARNRNTLEWRRASIFPAPSSPSAESLIPILKPFMEANPAASKHLRISVSGPSVVTRRIAIPIMTHAELKDAMRFEAESHVPFAIDECVLDFQILNQVPNQTIMNVLLAAAKRDFIQERLQLFSELGVVPEWIDIDTVCLVNAFEALNDGLANKSYGLLHIGHRMSSFVIIQDTFPSFIREVPFGGFDVTKAIMDAKSIEETPAEEFKIKKLPENAEELKAATQKGFESLVDELKNSVDFFQNETGEELKSIWMSGGGAMSYEAQALLSQPLGKEVTFWDNTKRLAVQAGVDQKFSSEHAAEFNVAFGAALRGLAGTK